MSSSLSSTLAALPFLLVGAVPQVVPPDDPTTVVARVGEVEITLGEMDAAAGEALEELWAKRYQSDAFYQRDLQKARAEALKKVVEEKHRAWTAAHGERSSPPAVEELTLRFEVSASGAPSLGADSAPVTLIEFVDFECPFSAHIEPALKAAMARYGDKVRRVAVSFPLASLKESAFRAAEVAHCAAEQGSYWQAHDLFLAQQARLRQDGAEELSRELQLDRSQLRECLASGRARLAVRRNQNAGFAGSVVGTPTTFINGLYHPGAPSEERLYGWIDAELVRLGLNLPGKAENGVVQPAEPKEQ